MGKKKDTKKIWKWLGYIWKWRADIIFFLLSLGLIYLFIGLPILLKRQDNIHATPTYNPTAFIVICLFHLLYFIFFARFTKNSDKRKNQPKLPLSYYIVNHFIYFMSFIFLYIFYWFFLRSNIIENIFGEVITKSGNVINVDIKNLFLAFSIIEICIIVIALFINSIRYAYKNIWSYEKGELFGNKKEEENTEKEKEVLAQIAAFTERREETNNIATKFFWLASAVTLLFFALFVGYSIIEGTNNWGAIVSRISSVVVVISAALFCALRYQKLWAIQEDYAYKVATIKSISPLVGKIQKLAKETKKDKISAEVMKKMAEEIMQDPQRVRSKKDVQLEGMVNVAEILANLSKKQ